MNSHDVYSFGVVASSTLYSIEGVFPAAEGYAEIDHVYHMTGGEAANSSIVLARLGVSVKLDGNWLGADENGARTKALLSDARVNTSRLPLKEGYQGVREVVFAAKATRTIFGSYGRLLKNAEWNEPQESDIIGAKVVCLDPFFKDAASQAARIAFQAGVPVVTVDSRFDEPLLRHAAAVVIAESFIGENYSQLRLTDLFDKYQRATGGVVVFTFGDKAIWYAGPGDAITRLQPRRVEAVDTTGAGDSFRAGVAYGFLRGWQLERTIEFAAALAALVCTRFPGVLQSPGFDEVLAFMRSPRT